MIRRYWEISCDYCGRVLGRQDLYAPKPSDCTNIAVVRGKHTFCNENCAADWSHAKDINRAGNLKQFQAGKKFERK